MATRADFEGDQPSDDKASALFETLCARRAEFPRLQAEAIVLHHDAMATFFGSQMLRRGAGTDAVLLLLVALRRQRDEAQIASVLQRALHAIPEANPAARLLMVLAAGHAEELDFDSLPLPKKARTILDFYCGEAALSRGEVGQARRYFCSVAESGEQTIETELAAAELTYIARGLRRFELTAADPYKLQNTAVDLRERGSAAAAIEFAEVALEQFLHYCGESHRDVAATRLTLASLFAAAGRHSAAWRAFSDAEPWLATSGDERMRAMMFSQRAELELLTATGDPVASAQQAIEALERSPDSDGEDRGAAWNVLARAYARANESALELDALQQGLVHRISACGAASLPASKSYFGLANFHIARGQFARAKPVALDALEIRQAQRSKDGVAVSLAQLAAIHLALQEHAEAERRAQEALATADITPPTQLSCEEILVRCKVALASSSETLSDALRAATRAAIVEDRALIEALRTASIRGGITCVAKHDACLNQLLLLHARCPEDEAIDRHVAERVIARKAIWRRYQELLSRRLRCAPDEHRRAAGEYVTTALQRWRSVLPPGYRNELASRDPTELVRLGRRMHELADLEMNSAVALEHLEAAGSLSLTDSECKALESGEALVSRVQATLDEHTMVVEFAWSHETDSDQFTVFCIDAQRVRHFTIGSGRSALSQPCETVFSLIAQRTDRRSEAELDAAERALVRGLWGPLRALSPSCTHYVMCPIGSLCLVAFDALRLEGSTFVLDQVAVSYAADASCLLPEPAATEQSGRAAVFGAPCFDLGAADAAACSEYFGPLPHAAFEAEQVAVITGGQLFVGASAATSSLLQQKCPVILHLATHGYSAHYLPDLRTAAPELLKHLVKVGRYRKTEAASVIDLLSEIPDSRLRCGVALTGCNDWLRTGEAPEPYGTGLATALDLGLLDLTGTELAVVSSCYSGVSDVLPNGPPLGIRAVLRACGARSTVTSLWAVSDRFGAELMIDMYQRLTAGSRRVDALRMAKLEAKARGVRRSAWGPFILEGRGDALGTSGRQAC